jgi:hypothetical protein
MLIVEAGAGTTRMVLSSFTSKQTFFGEDGTESDCFFSLSPVDSTSFLL